MDKFVLPKVKECKKYLKDKILQNEQDQIQEAYKAYVDSVRAAYGDGTEQEVQSR